MFRTSTDILQYCPYFPEEFPLVNMNIKPLTVVTSLAVVIAVATPVGLSAYLTRQDIIRSEKDRALGYAVDVLARSEAVTDQIDSGFKRLVASGISDPCSASSQALMRQIDLSSSYIQAIGYVAGNRMICSSLGTEIGGLELGPVDMDRASEVKLRLNVEFPFAKGLKFLAVERDSFVAIIHKELPIDTTTNAKDVSLATVAYPEGRVITGRGFISQNWSNALTAEPKTFLDGKYVVAVVAPKRYFIGAICAIPIANLNKRVYAASLFTVPIGLLASMLLAWALFRLAKVRYAMPAIIKNALKRKEFFLEYQPLIELSTGKWVGAEALIRWRRMEGEIVRPDIFIPVAEDNGLIQIISQYVVDEIASQAGDLFRQFPEFHIAINLSSADLHDKATVLMLRKLAAAVGAQRGNIIVEATERSLTNHGLANTVITQLRAEGFPVAIDDFGTGYSSLAYLESTKFDYLKIDKSFVDTLNTAAATSAVTLHIIEMAKSLNIEMIAEGVETELQAQFLRERGVQYVQGWLYAKPMSFDKLLLALQTSELEGGDLAVLPPTE
jgi:sensor c-di-GMP phosphodiesterase-like protein